MKFLYFCFVIYMTIIPVHAQSLIFNTSTEGGQFYAFKNGSLEGLSWIGHNATVNYELGDIITFTALPYLYYEVYKVCDDPMTECLTYQNYVYTVTGTLPDAMIASFKKPNQSTIIFNVTGQGQFIVFNGGDLVVSASKGFNGSASFKNGDVLTIMGYADQNNSLYSICDVPQTECNNLSTQVLIVENSDLLPDAMIATFSSNNYITIADMEAQLIYDYNSTTGTYSGIPNGTIFDTILRDNGYCPGDCSVGDMLRFISDNIYNFWILTFCGVLWRAWSLP